MHGLVVSQQKSGKMQRGFFNGGGNLRRVLHPLSGICFPSANNGEQRAVFIIQLGMLDQISLGMINSINRSVGSGEASRKKTATKFQVRDTEFLA